MSEFRLFCISFFIAAALTCAAFNRGMLGEVRDGTLGLLFWSLTVACAVVALFGKRGRS